MIDGPDQTVEQDGVGAGASEPRSGVNLRVVKKEPLAKPDTSV